MKILLKEKGRRMPKSNSDRQKKFRENMKKKGFTRVVVYVPSDRACEIKSMAQVMRDRGTNPTTFTKMSDALKQAKVALTPGIDQNTKNVALKNIKDAIKYSSVEHI